jgi:drug/metabolite transporter (DMT)-like permease
MNESVSALPVSKAQVIVVVMIAVLCVSVGEALVSVGMKSVHSKGAEGVRVLLDAVSDWRVLLGTAFMMAFFGLYALALGWADFSFVLPLTAVSFLFGALIAHLFLGETVSVTRWAGTLLIMAGVVIVGRGG